MTITTDFTGDEVTAEAHARIRAIANYYGANPQNLGDVRAALNPFLDDPIEAREFAGRFLPKLNKLNRGDMHWLNDLGGIVMWYDPSDLSTMFQDRTGSVPVTAPGQLVGVQLDKGQSLARGPELAINGDFSAGTTGWLDGGASVLSVVSGALRITSTITGVGSRIARQTYSGLVIGKTYEVTAEIKGSGGAGARQPRLEIRQGVSSYLSSPVYPDTPGPMRLVFVAAATVHHLWLRYDSSGGDLTTYVDYDNVSVRELPGFHKTAINDAARGTLMRHPASGARNRFRNSMFAGFSVGPVTPYTLSSEGANIGWTSSALNPLVEITARDDDAIDLRVYGSNTSGAICFVNVVDGLVIPAVAGMSRIISMELQLVANTGPDTPTVTMFSHWRDAGDVLLSGGSQTVVPTTTMTRFSSPAVAPANTAVLRNKGLYIQVNNGQTVDYTLRIRHIQVEFGAAETPYQATRRDGFDITEAGVADTWSIRTDGLNTGYVTPTVTPGTDKAQVFAAVQKLSDAGFGTIVEFSITSDVTPGSFGLFGRNQPGYTFSSMGSVRAAATVATGFPSPDTAVLTGLGDISGDSSLLKRNGVQVAITAGDQGTGNYATAPLYFYRRNGSINPLNGNAYGEVVRFGDPLTPAQIAQTERWLASKFGVTL